MSMNQYRKLANRCHEEEATRSSRDWTGRISRSNQRVKRQRNREAKREEARLALQGWE